MVQSVRDKLSADIIIKQTVSLSPEIVLEENTDEAWDAVIENNDELLEKYIAGEPISQELLRGRNSSGFRRLPVPSLSWQRQKWPWHSTVDGCGDRAVSNRLGNGGAALCGSVFQVEYTDCGQRRVYLRLYSGTLRLQDTVATAGKKLKITEAYSIQKGKCSDRHRLSG